MKKAQGEKKPAADKGERMRELHVRYEVEFVLDDPRMTTLSDRAGFMYVKLGALAVRIRREILPPEYDIKELAWRFRRTEEDMQAAIDELSAGRRPLLKVLEDGRIQVVGIKKKHARMKFKPDNTLSLVADKKSYDTHTPSYDSQRESYDGEPEENRKEPPHSPPCYDGVTGNDDPAEHHAPDVPSSAGTLPEQHSQRPSDEEDGADSVSLSPEMRVWSQQTANWNGYDDGKRRTAVALARAKLESEPAVVLAHVIEIGDDGRVQRPWAVLQKRLLSKADPRHADSIDRAYTLLRAAEGDHTHRDVTPIRELPYIETG